MRWWGGERFAAGSRQARAPQPRDRRPRPHHLTTSPPPKMLTARAWWFLFVTALVLFGGILMPPPVGPLPALVVLGLALLLWFGWEWLAFTVRLQAALRRLEVEREVFDDHGPTATLWAGRCFHVRVRLRGSPNGTVAVRYRVG